MMLIAHIRRDGGTQIRAGLDESTVADYVEQYRAQQKGGESRSMPDVEVFHDGTDHWLVDGFHRVEAALRAGQKRIAAAIKPGTQSAAILAACAANQTHGLRRSNADKRRAIKTALRHPESSEWSDRRIAKHTGVHHETVADARWELRGTTTEEPRGVTAQQGGDFATLSRVKDGQRREPADAVPSERSPAGEKGDEGAGATASAGAGRSADNVGAAPAPDEPSPEEEAWFEAQRAPKLAMDTLGLDIGPEKLAAWSLLESALAQFDNHLRSAQAVLTPLLGKAGQDADALQSLRQAAHDLAARARKSVAPKSVCLYCKDPDGEAGRKSQCNGCHGIGYLTEEQMGSVPRELVGSDKVFDQMHGGFVSAAPDKCKDCGGAKCGPVCRYTSRGNMRPVSSPRRLKIQDNAGRELVTERDDGDTQDTW